MAIYPGFEVQIKAPSKRKVELRGLDYKYMREYIQKHDDEQHSKMEKFKTLIAQDKKDKVEGAEHLEAAGYLDVRAWFLTAFPEIKQTREDHKAKVQAILAEVAWYLEIQYHENDWFQKLPDIIKKLTMLFHKETQNSTNSIIPPNLYI